MIGDGNGSSSKECDYSEKAFTEVVQKHLHVLQKFSNLKIEGHCGIIFDREHVEKALENKQISEEEYNILLSEILRDWEDADWDKIGEGYFNEEILNEGEYMFYVIENITITYIDENRQSHQVVWED